VNNLETRLRDSLAAHAEDAPDAAALAERIVSANQPVRARWFRSRGWRTWALPIVSAGAVAAVVAAVVAVTGDTQHRAQPQPPGLSSPVTPTGAPAPAAIGWKVSNVWFTDATHGWALADRICPVGARCPIRPPVVLHTTAGSEWSEVGPAPIALRDSMSDTAHGAGIGFVDGTTGYLWDESHAYATHDAGAHWAEITLGESRPNYYAIAGRTLVGVDESGMVFSLSDKAMRPTGQQLGGSWHSVLETAASAAYWVHYPHLISEGPAPTTFDWNPDGRELWVSRTAECPGTAPGAFIDPTALAFAPDGSIVATCYSRFAKPGDDFVTVSTDTGKTFTRTGNIPEGNFTLLAAASADVAIGENAGGVLRTGDGGRTWHLVPTLDRARLGPDNQPRPHFVTAKDGWLIDAYRKLWLTHDAGATWAPAPLGGTTTADPTPGATTSAPPTAAAPTDGSMPILDLTFVGKDAWMLESRDCSQTYGLCVSIKHTSDGGTSWQTTTAPADAHTMGSKGCSPNCVTNIRFATDKIGYLFGPNTLYLTTDGAKSWTRLKGDVAALETLDGNVIRIVTTRVGCGAPGCTYAAQTADPGSDKWSTAVPLASPVGNNVFSVLVRTHGAAYALERGNPAGGAENAKAVLSRSTDGGRSWTNLGEPCPPSPGPDGEADTSAIAVGTDGTLFDACYPRRVDSTARSGLVVSTDRGANFVNLSPSGLGPNEILLMAAADRQHVCVQTDALHCSHDGGTSWQRADRTGGPSQASWLGFESATHGTALASDGTALFTTDDGGTSWARYPIR